MISLELTFTDGAGGYSADPLTYKQIRRSVKVALYQRFYSDGRPKDFEVFIIRVDPKGKIQKFPGGVVKVVEDDTERYPSGGQFGFTAWSFGNLTAANARFEKLDKEENLPEGEEESAKTITLPVGEFTVGELVTANGVPYSQAAAFVRDGVKDKTINLLREERRGTSKKPSNIYAKA